MTLHIIYVRHDKDANLSQWPSDWKNPPLSTFLSGGMSVSGICVQC